MLDEAFRYQLLAVSQAGLKNVRKQARLESVASKFYGLWQDFPRKGE